MLIVARLSLAVFVIVLALLTTLSAQREVFKSFAASTLATAIDTDDTSVVVQSGHGARFPAISGTDFFYIVVENGPPVTAREVMKVTARTTDTLTVVRGQEGTSGTSFGTGVKVEQRVVATTLDALRDLANGFFRVSGPTAVRTYTLPDANATVLTSNAAVTIAQGGTGQTGATAAFDALSPTTTQGDISYHNGTDNIRLGIGLPFQKLRINSGATAVEWADAEVLFRVSADRATTSTTFVDVTDLILAVTSGTYVWECSLTVFSSVATVANHIGVNGPTNSALNWRSVAYPTVTTVQVNAGTAYDTAGTATAGVVTPGVPLTHLGSVVFTASGNFAIRQKAEAAGTVTVVRGSWCKIDRM
jgi:hypothetical protein